MAEAVWRDFVARPEDAQKQANFNAHVWAGVPANLRKSVWTTVGQNAIASAKNADIKPELERSVKVRVADVCVVDATVRSVGKKEGKNSSARALLAGGLGGKRDE